MHKYNMFHTNYKQIARNISNHAELHFLGKDEVTRSNRVSSSKGLESLWILNLFCSLKVFGYPVSF